LIFSTHKKKLKNTLKYFSIRKKIKKQFFFFYVYKIWPIPKREEGKKETDWAPNLAIIRRKLEGQENKRSHTWGLCFRGLQGTTHSSKYGELFSSLLFSSLLVQLSRSVMSPHCAKTEFEEGKKSKRKL
jgi:hypothetical protein